MSAGGLTVEQLDRQIERLTALLREKKRTRKSLKMSAKLKAQRKDAAFTAAIAGGVQEMWDDPARREYWLQRQAEGMKTYNRTLPWPAGTPERRTYERLQRNGVSREVAIAEIQQGHLTKSSAGALSPPIPQGVTPPPPPAEAPAGSGSHAGAGPERD